MNLYVGLDGKVVESVEIELDKVVVTFIEGDVLEIENPGPDTLEVAHIKTVTKPVTEREVIQC
jgi:hypothetical protein